MEIKGVDWNVIEELKKHLEPKLPDGQKLEITQKRRERETDMWGHMEYWEVMEVRVVEATTNRVIHKKTIRSSNNGTGLADTPWDRDQYSYRVDTSWFDDWFKTPQ